MRRCCLIHLKKSSTCQRVLVKSSDGQGREAEMIAKEDQGLGRLRVPEPDAPEVLRVTLAGVVAAFFVTRAKSNMQPTVQSDSLVADDAGRPVGRGRVDPMGVHVRFGPGDEECAGPVQVWRRAKST